MIKNIFIDLDGTLLPMDNDSFTKSYFSLLGDNIQGREKMELIQAVKTGTYSMFKNNAEVTCEEVFWKTYESIFGEGSKRNVCNRIDDSALAVKNFFTRAVNADL